MRLRAASGEIFLALAFVGAGAFWVLTALGMQLWEGFAPSSGFLPLVYGLLLMGLSVAALLLEARPNDRTEESNATIRQPLIVIAAMAAGVAGLEVALELIFREGLDAVIASMRSGWFSSAPE